MSDFRNTTKEDIAANIIVAPFLIIANALTISKKALVQKPAQKVVLPNEVPPIKKTVEDVFKPDSNFAIADKVHSQMFGSLKVCFYQYMAKGNIRAVARKNSVTKEIFFTPEIAKKNGVHYSMDSAIAWVREVGFKDTISANSPLADKPVSVVEDKTEKQEVIVTNPVVVRKPNVTATTTSSKNRPFTGKIISIGETTRPGRDGKPPYTSFAIKLRSESGGLEKEFLGEHLAELAEKLSLKSNQLIRLQLLGRNKFNVEINGENEERTRNEYAIDLI